MSTSSLFESPFRRVMRALRSQLGIAIVVATGLPVVLPIFFFVAARIVMESTGVDRNIPPERAVTLLADRLGRFYNVKLDPDARIVAAHEERSGMQGDGSEWFVVQLAPRRGPTFEPEFLASVRAISGATPVPFDATTLTGESIRHFGRGSRLPAAAHGWRLSDRTGDHVVFLHDKFFLYQVHF